MGIVLDFSSESAYNQAIDYLRQASIRGQRINGYAYYQIDPKIGRGLVMANLGMQTIELTDTIDRETERTILNATKSRRMQI
jgi:hypothetical protein